MLIPTHVAIMHNVERDVGVVVWAVKALPKYGEEMVLLDLVVRETRCKMHLRTLQSKRKELAKSHATYVELLGTGTRTDMQALN